MRDEKKNETMLGPYRALDLTDEKGFLCGKILADLGADVIKIEKPGGDYSRNIGPFFHDIYDPEKSLYWFAYNVNKRGITLDIETTDGREIFQRLVKTADFVIESFPVGYLDNIGLGYSQLNQVNPRIIMTSITPFGQTGPYKDYQSSDIVSMALGGLMYVIGQPDRPPVRMSFPQSFLHAGIEAALGTMLAHYYRATTGKGQIVDVSIQESLVWVPMHVQQAWDTNEEICHRMGVFRERPDTGIVSRYIWRCKDGWVSWIIMGGAASHFMHSLVKWMDEEAMADDFIKSIKWENYDFSTQTQESMDHISEPISKFFLARTMKELFTEGLKRDIPIYPISTPGDLLNNAQLASRDFWVELKHTELGVTIPYPGVFVKGSGAHCDIRHRAPLIGEHNREIYEQELGIPIDELIVLKQAGVI